MSESKNILGLSNIVFFKYQSLGNDFIVFDWYNQPQDQVQKTLEASTWQQRVIDLCNRHTGIGADGVLMLTKKDQQPFVRIFNADGTEAENCLNGLRCIAQHLVTEHQFTGTFTIGIGKKNISCSVTDDLVRTIVPGVLYQNAHTLHFSGGVLHGHLADAGNPHFIVFQKTTLAWLAQHGKELENHSDFPNKANISFVWPRPAGSYSVLTFERGCGITQACSSAAVAVLKTLAALGKIHPDEKIPLHMLGGTVSGSVDTRGNVVLHAQSYKVFQGKFL